ncbi:hypothetical protein E4U61_007572 [Claviceps capensis]|nr:hypothetical protein E4U61_007572 [Claviceps capensis]
MAIKLKSPSLSRHRFERSQRAKARPALAFDVKKLVGMTREEAECPNKRSVIQEFTTRFKEEDETDKSDNAKDLSETSLEEE